MIGTIEYWQTQKDLHHELQQEMRFVVWRPAFIIAVIMSVAGLLMFLSIISQLL
jgi:hypothetical protein